jgi:hypothetical protein
MSAIPYVARQGDRYSLRVGDASEFRLEPIEGGLRGLLQVSVHEVYDDGSVTERCRPFMPWMFDESCGDKWMCDPPGEGWEWRWQKEAYERRRHHTVWVMPADEAESLLAELGRRLEQIRAARKSAEICIR